MSAFKNTITEQRENNMQKLQCNEICHMYCGTQTCYKCKTSYFRKNGKNII